MTDELLKYKIGLSLIPKIGDVTAKKLIAYTGSVEAIFKEKRSSLIKIPGIGEQIVQNILNHNVLARAENEVVFINKHQIKVFFYLDDNYPNRLKHCNDSPIILYYKGNAELNNKKVLSIVGTRNATDYGKENCLKLIKSLKERCHNALIVSGLAYGIDISAHRYALENNLETIGVLAHGLDRIYPSLHKETAVEMIRKGGGILTEFISKTSIDRNYFLQRNRIIAGLSDAVLIIESGIKGGALVTADIASSYNRDVFAFPGRVNDKYSAGCNLLIKTNKAALIENIDDLENYLNWQPQSKNLQTIQLQIFKNLTDEEIQITDVLRQEGKTQIDMINMKTKIPMNKLSSLLVNLEFNGFVKCLPGNVYCLHS